MTKIRDDLDGVVYVSIDGGEPIRLQAGDDVPEGATIGDHLIARAKEPQPKSSGRRTRNTTDATNGAQD